MFSIFAYVMSGVTHSESGLPMVRFEYSRSDSEHKLLIGQFNLTNVK